jgi:hypothetical protein
MSIEQKVAQILAESRAKDSAETIEEANKVVANAQPGDQSVIKPAGSISAPPGGGGSGKEASGDQTPIRTAAQAINGPAGIEGDNEDNAENNVQDEDSAANGGPGKKTNKVTAKSEAGDQKPIRTATSVKEDVDALVNGEDLSEEFKAKAATIFEAAIITRVKDEVARLEEEFDAKLEEAVAQNQEGLVEKVDGYLSYVAEQWMENNEIALESGMKSDILEGFVSGLKGLFEEHYIDIPEEKFDVLGSMEETIADLQAKLDEQVAVNVEMAKVINESTRESIIADGAEGLAETDKEKFFGLAEELAFEDSETFAKKVQTIRENYFTNKASTIVESVVTDTPVEMIAEEVKKPVDPSISKYMSVLNNIK